MNFQTKYNYAQSDGEKMDPISRTEQAGYVPPKIQIDNMIMAGRRLAQARLEQFDEYNGNGSLEIDPTRRLGLDLAEASMLQAEAMENLRNPKNLQNQKGDEKTAEANQPAQPGGDGGK